MADALRSIRGRSPGWTMACTLLVAVSPAAAAGGAGTGDAADEDREPAFYETATVRSRPVSGAAASVTILDRETIETLDVPSVAELIRFVPGVDVATTGPRSGFATAQMRGGDPNYTYVLIDGVPLNDITDQVGGAVNLNSISTSHVERIEFVRGPLSSFFGSTGLAGAVNIITRRGGSRAPRLSFDIATGDDSAAVGAIGLSRGSERNDYFVGAFWEQQQDAIDAFGARDDYQQLGVQGNARLSLGDTAELRITGRYAMWDADDYPEASGGPRIGDGEIRRSAHDEVSFGVEALLGDGERRHRVRVTGFRHELDRDSPLIFNPANPAASVPASTEETTFATWQLGWTAPEVELGSARLNYGVDARLEDGESDSIFPDLLFDLSYRIDRTAVGVFAEFVIEHGRATFVIGSRVDVPEGFDTEVNPRAGISYRLPGDATRIRTSVGRAFKLPSFFALSVPVFGNPNLKPETVVGADAALEHEFRTAGLSIVLGVFYNRFDDLVDFDDTLFTHVNVPEVESHGAELSLGWRACEQVLLHASATRQSFDDDQAGDPLTHRPDWTGSTRVVWRMNDRARWGVDGQWVSEVYDFQVPLNGTQRTAGYQLYGTSVTIDVASGWTVHARIDNLADKEYEPYIGFPGPDRSFRVGLRRRSR